MIVPDQKVTVGALSEVILRWWKALNAPRNEGGCVYAVASTLKPVEIRV